MLAYPLSRTPTLPNSSFYVNSMRKWHTHPAVVYAASKMDFFAALAARL
jgi:hypothetical protein